MFQHQLKNLARYYFPVGNKTSKCCHADVFTRHLARHFDKTSTRHLKDVVFAYLKGCVQYILAVLFKKSKSLKESFFEARKNVFISKALFVEIFKF